MKKTLALSAVLLSGVFTAPTFAQTDTVNVKLVNDVINEIIAETFKGDDLVKSISLKLDETNTVVEYQNLRVAGKADAVVSRTPWDAAKQSMFFLNLDGKAIDVNQSTARTEVVINAGAQTDGLKLLNYVAAKILESAGAPDGTPDDQRAHEIFTKLSQSTTLEQVYTSSSELVALFIKKEPELAGKLTLVSSNEAGAVSEVVLRYADPKDSFFSLVNIIFDVKLRADQLNIGLKFQTSYPQEMKELLEEVKASLINLQNKADKEVQKLKEVIQSVNESVRALVDGQ